MVELHKACELVLPCALSTSFQTELCLAGLQACFQGVPWWSFKMTGRPSRPAPAPALAFFARSWTTTAKACRLASQPCQPPEVDEPACHAWPWSPTAFVICFSPTYWSLREAAGFTAISNLKRMPVRPRPWLLIDCEVHSCLSPGTCLKQLLFPIPKCIISFRNFTPTPIS